MPRVEPLPIVLLGAGGHARACIDVIEAEGRFAIAGIIGVAGEVGSSVLGYPVVGTDDNISSYLARHTYALVTVGQIKSSGIRRRLFEHIERHGRKTPAIVSPRAYVSRHALLGEGSIVLHGAVVNAGATIGRNCIINSMALVEHDARVGDHCHVSTGARVNSGVLVGDGSFLGSGCAIRQGVVVGPDTIVGIGAVVLSNCAGSEVVVSRGADK